MAVSLWVSFRWLRRNSALATVVEGGCGRLDSSSCSPSIPIICSTNMTTPTAVMKPFSRARERTTSRKPIRKRPSAKVMTPTCDTSASVSNASQPQTPDAMSDTHLEPNRCGDVDSDRHLLRGED